MGRKLSAYKTNWMLDSDRLKAGIEMIAPPDPAKFEVCSAAPLPRRAVTSER